MTLLVASARAFTRESSTAQASMSCRPKSFRSRAALRSGTMAGSFSRPAADQIWSSVPSTLRSHQAVTFLLGASTRSVLRMPRRPSENMTALTGISCGRSVPSDGVRFQKPRGLRSSRHGRLSCVAQDEVVAFDFETGDCLGAVCEAAWSQRAGGDPVSLS